MPDIENVITGLELCTDISQDGCMMLCPYKDEQDETYGLCEHIMKQDAITLLKEQKGLILALDQANATINYLNEEKENAIKEIEERKAFNLKCDGQPEWLRKGIDVGLNTALDILKGKGGEQE